VLCREFGLEPVGLSTGDASVNRTRQILCCTAKVLANIALREGADADVQHVVMDEFHYYADRDRGVAWQVPLLAGPITATGPCRKGCARGSPAHGVGAHSSTSVLTDPGAWGHNLRRQWAICPVPGGRDVE
jgi:hypothetical protein